MIVDGPPEVDVLVVRFPLNWVRFPPIKFDFIWVVADS